MNIESLSQSAGYRHAESRSELRASAKTCPMCKLMEDSLKTCTDEAELVAKSAFICRFYRLGESEVSKVALEIENSRDHRGYVRTYTSQGDIYLDVVLPDLIGHS